MREKKQKRPPSAQLALKGAYLSRAEAVLLHARGFTLGLLEANVDMQLRRDLLTTLRALEISIHTLQDVHARTSPYQTFT